MVVGAPEVSRGQRPEPRADPDPTRHAPRVPTPARHCHRCRETPTVTDVLMQNCHRRPETSQPCCRGRYAHICGGLQRAIRDGSGGRPPGRAPMPPPGSCQRWEETSRSDFGGHRQPRIHGHRGGQFIDNAIMGSCHSTQAQPAWRSQRHLRSRRVVRPDEYYCWRGDSLQLERTSA